MTTIEYRGYSICQKSEFGPLRLLKWVEEGAFTVTKGNADAMHGTRFRTIDDAKHVIDTIENTLAAIWKRPAIL
ncbi:MAG TPA: hypothetical protein VNZ03_29800 [Terriglobales bacterium]|jgi:hypothetical protein|nr:hypothetical protein [Terriglobales bacterium]